MSRGRTLLSLTGNSVSLEQIFLRLTEAADNDEARRMLGYGVTEVTEDFVPETEEITEIKEEGDEE